MKNDSLKNRPDEIQLIKSAIKVYSKFFIQDILDSNPSALKTDTEIEALLEDSYYFIQRYIECRAEKKNTKKG